MGTHHQCDHSHDRAHGHSHGHHHHHHHHGASERVGLVFFLNLGFALIELVGGLLTNSMAVLSDALHDFGDALALGVAWWMEKKSNKAHDEDYSYGYRRFSVASALVTGVILLSGSLWVLFESIPRLIHPEPVQVRGMLGLAVLGVLVNGFAFVKLSFGGSLNEKVLKLHLIEDMAGWILVLVGAAAMFFFEIPWLDPLMALGLSIWVIFNVFRNLKETVLVLLQGVPRDLKLDDVQSWMRKQPGVMDVHHLHVWSLDGEKHILTGHIVISGEAPVLDTSKIKFDLKTGLKKMFHIMEATLEIETPGESCHDPRHGDSKEKH